MTRHSTSADILDSIARFQAGELRLSALLDRLWAQIHDLPPGPETDAVMLEDCWTEMEIIYAQASAAEQPALDADQARALEGAIAQLVSALGDGMP
ncbi:hypothetical protein [Rhodovarius lipocyclicus]|uniref:hypothetical protein n=1 Tax=Rhodovarius lipocyclicus TaxID=268410 RepID=UPI00135BADE3|nr:hypothetical protein [Rhodovarius lipocyclicus]